MIIGLVGKKQSGKNTVATILQELLLEEGYIFEQKAFAFKVKKIVSILTGIPTKDMEQEDVKNKKLPEEWNKWFVTEFFKGENIKHGPFYSNKVAVTFINKNQIKNFKLSKEPITIRQTLQYVGTNLFRDMFDKDVWINSLFSDYKEYTEIQSNMVFDRTLKKYVVPPGHGKHTGRTFSEGADFSYELDTPVYPNWIITDVRFSNEADAVTDRGGFLIKIDRPSTRHKDFHESETSIDLIKTVDFYLTNPFDTKEELYYYIRKNLLPFILKSFNLK